MPPAARPRSSSAAATALVVLFLAAPLGLLPLAALGAMLIFSAMALLDVRAWRRLRRIDRFEFRLSVLTTIGVLTIGVLPGVVLAILLATVNVLVKIYQPHDAVLGEVPGLDGYNDIALDPRAQTLPGRILYRFDGPLLFFNTAHFKARVRDLIGSASPPPRWFVLSVESVTQTDISGLEALEEIHAELAAQGIELLIARPKLYMRRYGEAMGLGQRIGYENIFPSVRAAVETILARTASGASTRPVDLPVDQSFRALLERAEGKGGGDFRQEDDR